MNENIGVFGTIVNVASTIYNIPGRIASSIYSKLVCNPPVGNPITSSIIPHCSGDEDSSPTLLAPLPELISTMPLSNCISNEEPKVPALDEVVSVKNRKNRKQKARNLSRAAARKIREQVYWYNICNGAPTSSNLMSDD